MNELLKRQIALYLGEDSKLPDEFEPLFEAVSHAYDSADQAVQAARAIADSRTEESNSILPRQHSPCHPDADPLETNEALRARAAYLQALIEKSSDGILVVDASGTPHYSHLPIAFAHIDPNDFQKAIDSLNQIIQYPGAKVFTEVRVQGKDGTWRYAEITGTNYLDDPQVRGMVLAFRDITDRKRAEEALQETEDKLSTVFENANDIIVYVDNGGQIIDVNEKGSLTIGYSREELVGANFLQLNAFDPEEALRIMYLFGDGATSGGPIHFLVETQLQHRDGHSIPVEASASAVRRQDGTMSGFLAILRDITERKEAEQELRRYADELAERYRQLIEAREELAILNQGLEQKVTERTAEVEKLLQQKNSFIWQLSHDLKTPLTPLVGILSMIKQDATDEEQLELLDLAIENINYMRELAAKTLRLARLNSAAPTATLAKVNLPAQVHAVMAGREPMAAEKGIRLRNSIAGQILVKADETALRELLDNLVSNAIKYTPEGGAVSIEANMGDQVVTVSVADTGIGMTEEQKRHAFDEFYKADPARHDLESSGLGLAICKRIIDQHSGEIRVESRGLDKGSTIFFTLQLAEGEDCAQEEERSCPAECAPK